MAPNQLPPALLQRCPEVFANGICLVLPIYSKGKDMAALFREADWGRYNFNASTAFSATAGSRPSARECP